MTNSKCPKCGAKAVGKPTGHMIYECCTEVTNGETVCQSTPCKLRCAEKRIATLEAALKPFANPGKWSKYERWVVTNGIGVWVTDWIFNGTTEDHERAAKAGGEG